MISGITREIGGTRHAFRLTPRAMMHAEDLFDAGIAEIVSKLEGDFRASTVVKLIAVAGNDGAGMPIEDAQAVVDEIGMPQAAELLGAVVEAAFPEAGEAGAKATGKAGAKAGAASGNAKRAASA